MRGLVHYGPHPVVAILDSTRAGRATRGSRSSGPSRRPCRSARRRPLSASQHRADASPAWRGAAEGLDSRRALDLESGLHEFISDDPELSALADEHGVELRRSPQAAGRPERPDGREPAAPGDDGAHRRLRPRDREEDGRGRARLAARRRGLQSVFVPTGQTDLIAGRGIAIERRVGLPGRRGRAAGGRRSRSRRGAPLGRGAGIAGAPRRIPGSRWA